MRGSSLILFVSALGVGFTLPALAEEGVPLAAYTIVDGATIPEALGGLTGDAVRGRDLVRESAVPPCATCHDDGFSGAAPRDPGVVRMWLVAPDLLGPDAGMPSYYQAGQRKDPNDPRHGEPWLRPQEIEDIIAYLTQRGRE